MRKPPTDRDGTGLERALARSLDRLARACGTDTPTVHAGFSGGLDSSVLLHLLVAQARAGRLALRAVHVDHGLSPNASAWVAHCRDACAAYGVELRVAAVAVGRAGGQSLEEQAREARYRVYESLGDGVVALAHHADDQAETLLLQLLRGAGPKGLAAMPELALQRRGARIWRPLLGVSRAEIAAAGRAAGLHWIEDESNRDTALRRNFLRSRILPLLAQAFPHPARTMARAARLQGDAASLLDELADADLAVLLSSDGHALALQPLSLLGPARQANVLRRWLARAGTRAPSEARLQAMLVALSAPGRRGRMEWWLGGIGVRRRGLRLELVRREPPQSGADGAENTRI
ncbi:MAG: tRNA lysidine(34) synthetase TilS [Burkholderiales bacterium]|nr:tRNA lysidine(34) synthetase TilS [Burkholderiales bacterium]